MPSKRSEAGFSLLEAIVAIGLMAGALASLGQMLAISVAINRSAGVRSDATVLAQQKMEQLLAQSTAGTGSSPSSGGSLTSNADGWFDVVDRSGQSLVGAESPGEGGVYIRRWAVESLSSTIADLAVIHVLVASGHGVSGSASTRPRDEVRLSSIRTYNAP